MHRSPDPGIVDFHDLMERHLIVAGHKPGGGPAKILPHVCKRAAVEVG
jgi:hypothetical protein